MKNVIGIVVEYNPFHNGHLYQINKIKELYPNSLIIVCMSSSFTQRGELSILNKWDKTIVALNHGIDIVIELPYLYSTQSSDIFAKYSIKLLNELKINTLIFGSESDNIDELLNNAKIQLYNNDFDIKVKEYMNNGINYPTALNNALKDLNGSSINTPNDLLGLSYIKEVLNNNYNIEIKSIKRTSDYHDVNSNDNIISASNIRNKLLNNIDIKKNVPNDVFNLLKMKKLNNKYFEYLKYKILSEEDLNKYLDVDEGLSTRIKNVIKKSDSLEELIQNIKTKRYTYNKISRMLNHILCSLTKEEVKSINDLEYIRILGFSKEGQNYLKSIKSNIKMPILNKYDTKKYKSLNIEKRVTNIYSLIYEDINDLEIKNKPSKM
ncbi:MAG: nucleotidyltransferase [Bacilli bacterium]|nr:nucleotidyltransferase [Bacilli bacterium]